MDFPNHTGYTGFVLTNDLIQIVLISTGKNKNHVDMIWHYHIFVNRNTIIVRRQLLQMRFRDLPEFR